VPFFATLFIFFAFLGVSRARAGDGRFFALDLEVDEDRRIGEVDDLDGKLLFSSTVLLALANERTGELDLEGELVSLSIFRFAGAVACGLVGEAPFLFLSVAAAAAKNDLTVLSLGMGWRASLDRNFKLVMSGDTAYQANRSGVVRRAWASICRCTAGVGRSNQDWAKASSQMQTGIR